MKYSNKLTLLLVLVVITGVSCVIPGITQLLPSTQSVAHAQVIATHDPFATVTRTPFQPIGPTSTPTITFTPTVTETPTATEIVFTDTPTPWYEGAVVPEGVVTIMILGTDYRPGSGYRTDVMVLAAVNPQLQIVNAVSFPRDLYVDIPGRGMNRLNTAMPFGGFSLLSETLETNFHVRPDYYIMTNFTGFANIINSLGGIEVHASYNLTDRCDLSWAVEGTCSVGPGLVTMDGETALWYVRARYSSNDFARNRRQQEILLAIFRRFASFDVITRAPELYDAYLGTVETDLDLGTILKLIPIVPSITEPERIHRYYIGASEVSNYVTPDGAMVLVPNNLAIEAIIRKAIYFLDN